MNPMNPHADLYTGEAGKRVFNFTNNNSWGWGVPMGWKPTISTLAEKSSNDCEIAKLSGMIFSDVPVSDNDYIIVNPNPGDYRVFKIISCKNLGNPADCWHITAVSDGLYIKNYEHEHFKQYTWEVLENEWPKDDIMNKLIPDRNS